MLKNTGHYSGYSDKSNWSIHIFGDRIVINNHGMKLVATGVEEHAKLTFDVEKHTIVAEVKTPMKEGVPRVADLSDDVEFFNDLRGQMTEILHFAGLDEVKVNDDKTIFEITFPNLSLTSLHASS